MRVRRQAPAELTLVGPPPQSPAPQVLQLLQQGVGGPLRLL